ncbi:oxygenase MpaB family protein [Agromyces allii]|uniref:ER-bound oxygenase mpaB/mpaB'/Rubber oxygenase catalytic domain-containing protein n=1 Tax=Agromyces allii TaxID=393607 RepID=A0ABP5BTV0_9MICO|nr:oxygenase MpaB family protein [Agromyces allii]
MEPADAEHDDHAVFRRHGAEAVLLLGGAAAILLQLADPRVARGVARHSDFASRPLDRLIGTLDYVYAVGFGDDEIAAAAVRRVNARHAPVRSRPGATDESTDAAYSAFDADAQRWVASTLLAVALDIHERVYGPLPPTDADAIVRGYAPLGFRLQGSREGWPDTRQEFDAWWNARLGTLRVTDEARHVARTLLSTSDALRGLSFLLPPVRLVTAELLPPALRDAYGFRWTPRARRVAQAWLAAVAAVWPWLPRIVRHAPMRVSLHRARRRYAERVHRGR